MKKNRTTIVTGLWDLGRDKLGEGWSRSFEDYLKRFKQLMRMKESMIIFGPKDLESFVWLHRGRENTLFVERDLSWFRQADFYDRISAIRGKEKWLNQAGWLRESPQAQLDMYALLVMSKPFLLNDARISDTFDSSHLFWLDAGIAQTVHPGYFYHDGVLDNIHPDRMMFVTYPYKAENEIHGFSMEYYRKLDLDVKMVCRGGFFGGPVDQIHEFTMQYYEFMNNTLWRGLLGTEESLFTLMLYYQPERFVYHKINEDGLLSTFFEKCKDKAPLLHSLKPVAREMKSNVYILTFNSPEQVKLILTSMKVREPALLDECSVYLIDQSSESIYNGQNDKICREWGINHIVQENKGVQGGRLTAAKHFRASDADFYYFFEEDMAFYIGNDYCKNGFPRTVNNLHEKVTKIMLIEQFDFLKLNFTEFYGSNDRQWAWFNVPQHVRKELFPERPERLTESIYETPFTVFKNIKSFQGLAYATGEIYYCNWPQIVSRKGNEKMFFETQFEHPYEQTWMSFIYQETKKGNINPGVLLATPTVHNRFQHYDGSLRREN